MRRTLKIELGICISITCILLSCTNKQRKLYIDLPDKYFPLKNLKNTYLGAAFYQNNSYVTQEGKKIEFTYLDSLQAHKLLSPVIDSGVNVDLGKAFFVAKQEKVGNIQPIIIEYNGEDFDALFMVLLDLNNKPVSSYILNGGWNGGPDNIGDSIMVLIPDINSEMESGRIITHIVKTYAHVKNEELSAFNVVDSITCETQILPNGTFQTHNKDSVRFHR